MPTTVIGVLLATFATLVKAKAWTQKLYWGLILLLFGASLGISSAVFCGHADDYWIPRDMHGAIVLDTSMYVCFVVEDLTRVWILASWILAPNGQSWRVLQFFPHN